MDTASEAQPQIVIQDGKEVYAKGVKDAKTERSFAPASVAAAELARLPAFSTYINM